MFCRVVVFVALSVLIAGCAGAPALSPVGADHPANPKAAEAPVPRASQTLAMSESSDVAKPDESTAPMAHQHVGHDMSGMKHDMGGVYGMMDMQHQTPPTQPSDGAAPSAPRFTSTSVPATTQASVVYTCRMHPEVISDKPGKCPKCGMKLVKKEGTP